jgi:hypothetical protein
MPFKKVGTNDYTGPSGRHFNQAQVRLYYAHGGKFPGQQGAAKGGSIMRDVPMTKGERPREAAYAAGGAVLGRTKDFMKMKDEFRDPDEVNPNADEDQKYGKEGDGAGTGEVKPPKAPATKKIK